MVEYYILKISFLYYALLVCGGICTGSSEMRSRCCGGVNSVVME
jgi:hypothetical protein